MTINLLDHFLITQLGAFLLIFARLGAALMFTPIFGDHYVPVRIRLGFAVMLALVLVPTLGDKIPPLPGSAFTLVLLLACEVLIGIFIGMIARTITGILHTAGTIMAFQSSLAVSSVFDPVTGSQTAVISNFLTMVAITIMLVLNLHHYMIAAMAQSYEIFTPGAYPMAEDMLKHFSRLVADCFTLGIILAAPHIVFSLILYLMAGLMARLMPNFQVFYLIMAPHVLLALLLLLLMLPPMMQVFTNYATDQLMHFAGEE